MKLIVPVVIATLWLIGAAAMAGEIYHCENRDGSKIIQGTPCEEKTVKTDEYGSAESTSTKQQTGPDTGGMEVITLSQLSGEWTDLPLAAENDSYRSSWIFSDGTLVTRRATGISHTHSYLLEGNTLTIRYEGDSLSKSWTKQIELVSFDGVKLEFGKGAPAGQKYLYKM